MNTITNIETVLAAGDIETVVNNLQRFAQYLAAAVVTIGGVAIIAYKAVQSKFSVVALLGAAAGVIVAAFLVFQIVGLIGATKSGGSSVTGVRSTYGLSESILDSTAGGI